MTLKSWVATAIIAPIGVGIILLQAEYFFFSKEAELKTASSGGVLEKARQIVDQIEPIQKYEKSFVESDVGNLQTLFEIAGKIYGPTERNAEYVGLIQLALVEGKPGFAYEIAKEIYGPTERNKQFVKIIDECLKRKMYSLSLKVAEQIYGPTERNLQYRKIIESGKAEMRRD